MDRVETARTYVEHQEGESGAHVTNVTCVEYVNLKPCYIIWNEIECDTKLKLNRIIGACA